MADNVAATAGSGTTLRFFQDTNSVEWGGAILAYVTGGSAGAWNTQYIQAANGLPVQPQTGSTWAVSAASLPLPAGASTAAKQPALGTAGTASTDVITVQGIASMTALKVDGSGVTQPVSGTFWQATQPVSGTFWQATQPVSGTVTSNQGGSNWSMNVAQVAGTATDTNSGTKSAGTIRVVLATDQPQLTNKLLVTPDALPAGTADIGKVRFSLPTTDALSEAKIDVAGNGDNTIVAGVSSQTVRVYRIFFVCDAAVNVTIKDGASTTLTGAMVMTASGAFVLDLAGEPWFTTSSANAFVINLSGAVGIRGRCYYTQS